MGIANISGNILTDSGTNLSTLVSGSGTTNTLSKWTASGVLGDSIIFDNGTNVGIGTSTPLGKLHVSSPTAVSAYIVSSGGDYDTNLYLGYGSVYTDTYIKRIVGNLSLGTSATDRLYISSGGNVGIGTSSPAVTLHTLGKIRSQDSRGGSYAAVEIYGGDSSYFPYISVDQSNPLTFITGGSERMRITSSGNVGIGTSSPSYLLDVSGIISSTTEFRLNNSFTRVATIDSGGSFGGGYNFNWNNVSPKHDSTGALSGYAYASDGTIRFYTDGSAAANTAAPERMRITSGGYTKMSNTGTYVSATGNYHEMRTSQTDEWTTFIQNTAASPYGVTIRYPSASPNGGGNEILYTADSTGQRATIRSNGGIANYQSNNVNLSDIRTKKDIIPLESYWDKFKAIEIVKFKYKDQSHDDFNIGVIAQQVEKVAPEFVDIDGWDSKLDVQNEEPLKSIYTEDLHHATIKVLQESMAKIEELEAKVTALENK